MSKKDLNTGFSDCIWKYKEHHDIYDALYDTACGSEFSSLGKCDAHGDRHCPKCGKQIRVESK